MRCLVHIRIRITLDFVTNSLTKKIYKRYLEPLKRHEMFEIKFIRQTIYDEGFMMINL